MLQNILNPLGVRGRGEFHRNFRNVSKVLSSRGAPGDLRPLQYVSDALQRFPRGLRSVPGVLI